MLVIPLTDVPQGSPSSDGVDREHSSDSHMVAVRIIGIVGYCGDPAPTCSLPQKGQKTASEGTFLPQFGHEGPVTPELEETSGSIVPS